MIFVCVCFSFGYYSINYVLTKRFAVTTFNQAIGFPIKYMNFFVFIKCVSVCVISCGNNIDYRCLVNKVSLKWLPHHNITTKRFYYYCLLFYELTVLLTWNLNFHAQTTYLSLSAFIISYSQQARVLCLPQFDY